MLASGERQALPAVAGADTRHLDQLDFQHAIDRGSECIGWFRHGPQRHPRVLVELADRLHRVLDD